MTLARALACLSVLSVVAGCGTGTGAAPEAAMCDPSTAESVRIAYDDPGVTPVACDHFTEAGRRDVIVRRATVVAAADDATGARLTLDFCPPAADCIAMPGSLVIGAPGFRIGDGTVALAAGQFVEIRWHEETPYGLGGCSRQVEVWNASSWDGLANPVRHDDAMLFAATAGFRTSMSGAAIGVTTRSIGCVGTGMGCGDGPPQTLGLVFTSSDASIAPLLLQQGQHAVLSRGSLFYDASADAAVISGACDDSGYFAWTVREHPTPTD